MPVERRTVLLLGARAPVALDLARRFAAHGWTVIAGDSLSCRITTWSRAVSAHVALPPPRTQPTAYAQALREAIHRHDVSLVVPTCEEAFHLAYARPHLPDAVRVCVSDPDTLRRLHSKWHFLALAAQAGADVPDSARVSTLEDARAWAGRRPVVLKPEFSRFGVHVRLYPAGIPADAPPFAVAGHWVAQAFCRGRELCSYAVADRGRLLAHVAYRPVHRLRGSASYYFEPCDAPQAARCAERLVALLGYTGQLAFDWIEGENGRLRVLECNPRAVSGVHLFADDDDLPGALIGEAPACIVPTTTVPRMLATVMAGTAITSLTRLPGWWHDWQRARDVIGRTGDNGPLAGSVIDLCSHAFTALRHGISLREATTHDCEWDGTPPGDAT